MTAFCEKVIADDPSGSRTKVHKGVTSTLDLWALLQMHSELGPPILGIFRTRQQVWDDTWAADICGYHQHDETAEGAF